MTYTLVMVAIYLVAVAVIAYVIWKNKIKNKKRRYEKCVLTKKKSRSNLTELRKNLTGITGSEGTSKQSKRS